MQFLIPSLLEQHCSHHPHIHNCKHIFLIGSFHYESMNLGKLGSLIIYYYKNWHLNNIGHQNYYNKLQLYITFCLQTNSEVL
ncbi:unnamed protein product [Blepharisma stoltei]|uniref:Uncharacterized protein n=1 Tax=Blepharisma stoltei TaxID=1481888 RepID=A0AAU9KSP9_9CILI|nr:unnamed protein product [Blepharisma stoltei]